MEAKAEKKRGFDKEKVLNSPRMLGLWHLMRGYHFHYLVATAFLAVAAFARAGIYLHLGNFIDALRSSAGLQSKAIITSALAFLGLIMLQALSTFMSSWMASFTAENTTRRLRDQLFDHIQRLTYAYHAEAKTGDLLERATSDVDTLRRFFADQAIGMGRIVFIFFINFALIFRMQPRLAWVSVAIVPVTLTISMLFFRKLRKAYEEYQEQEAIITTHLQETLSGVRVVKAFARQDYETDKFAKNSMEKLRRGKRMMFLHSIFWPISDIICGLQRVTSTYIAASAVIDQTLSLGEFITFQGLLSWLIWPIRGLGRLIIDTSRALVSLGRILIVLKAEEEDLFTARYQPEGDTKGAIKFENVCFAYEENQPVLKNVSFECKPGDVIALLGSTGSGKTSLVNLLPRFYDVNSGQILLDGVNLNDYSRDYLRSQIGIVEQEPFLFSCSIRDNITYGMRREVSQEEVEKAAREAAMHDVILEFKEGYDTMVGERGVTLSGGQKQRVAIARALLLNPRILILDDSTSSVDMETEVQIRAALDRLMTDRTTFVIAHRIQSIMNADQILVFDRGELVQHGTHDELLTQEGIYKEIYDIQTRIESALQEEIDSVTKL